VQRPGEDFSCWLAPSARFFRSDSRTGHSSLSSSRRIPISSLEDERETTHRLFVARTWARGPTPAGRRDPRHRILPRDSRIGSIDRDSSLRTRFVTLRPNGSFRCRCVSVNGAESPRESQIRTSRELEAREEFSCDPHSNAACSPLVAFSQVLCARERVAGCRLLTRLSQCPGDIYGATVELARPRYPYRALLRKEFDLAGCAVGTRVQTRASDAQCVSAFAFEGPRGASKTQPARLRAPRGCARARNDTRARGSTGRPYRGRAWRIRYATRSAFRVGRCAFPEIRGEGSRSDAFDISTVYLDARARARYDSKALRDVIDFPSTRLSRVSSPASSLTLSVESNVRAKLESAIAVTR